MVSHLRSLLPPGSAYTIVSAVVNFDTQPGSVAKLISVFETNAVDTIISCLFTPDAKALEEADSALFEAALAVEGVRRYGPDDWAAGIEMCVHRPCLHLVRWIERKKKRQ